MARATNPLFVLVVVVATTFAGARAAAQGQARGAAPIDLTGNWVAVISEDWRWRMVTPSKGDFPSIPLNMKGQEMAEAWDPAKDEAAGEQCRAYGAPGLMRGPTRLRISSPSARRPGPHRERGRAPRAPNGLRPAPAAEPARSGSGI
jgi:hypothetical protein